MTNKDEDRQDEDKYEGQKKMERETEETSLEGLNMIIIISYLYRRQYCKKKTLHLSQT